MFIPVSLISGDTHVEVEIDVSGTLTAQCQVEYAGQFYAPNTPIAVLRTHKAKLYTTVVGYAEIRVTLAGKVHYWYVNKPQPLRYVTGTEYKTLRGSVPGRVLNVDTNIAYSYVQTPTFEPGDALASIDFYKKTVWFFNKLGHVKKLVLTTPIVEVVYLPRWSSVSGIATTCYVVTESQVHKLDSSYTIEESFDIETGVVAASGDVGGFIVLAYTDRLVRWRTTGVDSQIYQQTLVGIHSLFVTPDNTYVVGCETGIVFVAAEDGVWFSDIVTSNKGLYWAFDISETHLYAVDAKNRCLVEIELGERTYSATYFPHVPRSVVVGDEGFLYVGFLDTAESLKVSLDLTTSTPITGLKAYGATYLDGYVVTDLYEDAAPVTVLEPELPQAVTVVSDIALDTPLTHQWTVNWERPEFVRLGATPIVVRVNGNVFTSGYLRAGDSVTFTVPANSKHYDVLEATFIGRRAETFNFRTVPKLLPDVVTIEPVLAAFLRVQYEDLFAISGLTYGFSIPIRTDSTLMEFSVNGGPYGTSGSVQNDDVVIVRAAVVSLLSTRASHTITTNGELVSSWYVLPMLLDGVTKYESATLYKERNHLTGVVASTEAVIVQPKVSDAARIESVNVFGVLGANATPLTFGDINAHFEVSGPTRTYASATPDGMLAYGPSTEYAPLVQPDLLGYTSVASDMPVNTTALPVTTASTQGNGAVLPSLTVLLSQASNFAVQEGDTTHAQASTHGTLQHGSSVQLSSACLLALSTTYGSTYCVIEQRANYTISLLPTSYMESSLYTVVENAIEFTPLNALPALKVNTEADSIALYTVLTSESEAKSRNAGTAYSTLTVTDQRETSLPTYSSSLAHRNAHATANAVYADFDRIVRHSTVQTTSLAALNPGASQSFGGASYLRQERSDSTPTDASYGVIKVSGTYDIDSTVDRALGQTALTTEVTVKLRPSGGILIDRPTVFAVHSSTSDVVLADQNSGFGDLAQAQAYAQQINVANVANYFQVQGKWLFTVAPDANTAACGIGDIPQTALARTFGYLGGG